MPHPDYPFDVTLVPAGRERVQWARLRAEREQSQADKARTYLRALGKYVLLHVDNHAAPIGVSREIFYYVLHDLNWRHVARGVWVSPRQRPEPDGFDVDLDTAP